LLNYLKDIDSRLLLAINSMHSDLIDSLMIVLSEKTSWIPFYGLILVLIIIKYKWRSWLVLTCIALLITASDQLTSGFMKPYFERLRPCHEETLVKLLYLPIGCGGAYGFVSSHAANSFAAATFLWLLLHRHFRAVVLLFPWAFMICYSRIYLGAHYPGDVIGGMIIGSCLGYLFFRIYTLADQKITKPIKAG